MKKITGKITAFMSNTTMRLINDLSGKEQFLIMNNPLMWLHIGDHVELEMNDKGIVEFGTRLNENGFPILVSDSTIKEVKSVE